MIRSHGTTHPRRLSLDDLGHDERQRTVAHLQECGDCRRKAIAEDPTLAFSLLPAAPVSEDEIDSVRRAVSALKAAKAIEAAESAPASRRLVAAGLAAILLLALLLVPQLRRADVPAQVPFAGAVGVGSGLVQIPETALATGADGTLRLELYSGREVGPGPAATASRRHWTVEVPVEVGRRVARQLGGGYALSFVMRSGAESGDLELAEFELSQVLSPGEAGVVLVAADLRASLGRRLIVDSIPAAAGREASWLELIWLGDR